MKIHPTITEGTRVKFSKVWDGQIEGLTCYPVIASFVGQPGIVRGLNREETIVNVFYDTGAGQMAFSIPMSVLESVEFNYEEQHPS